MKKMTNVEVELICLDSNDMICTSPTVHNELSTQSIFVGGRFSDEYDEEEEW